jgi:dTDP-glucose pyrophosphorylase
MKVVILCGGKGTRLREETEYRPKPITVPQPTSKPRTANLFKRIRLTATV